MNRQVRSWMVVLMLLAAPGLALADAAGDLKAGQAALAAGEVDEALPLLQSAAQALPKSVEAQFALGQAYLRLGELDKALTQFQAALALAPKYEPARKMVEVLTGRKRTFDDQIAYAKSLMSMGEYASAGSVLKKLVAGPADPAQRLAARLLLAEASLWGPSSRSGTSSLFEATRVIHDAEGKPEANIARVIAALALAGDKRRKDDVVNLLEAIPDIPPVWQERAALAILMVGIDEETAARVSGRLAGALASVPARSSYRRAALARLSQELLRQAHACLGRNDTTGAIAIVWPMVSSGRAPSTDAVLKPVPVAGGWLDDDAMGPATRINVCDLLAAVSKADFTAKGTKASLLGYWLAGEVLAQTPLTESARKAVIQESLKLAGELVSLSRPAPDRKQGTVLSRADEVQLRWLARLAKVLTEPRDRGRLADLAIAHISRYEKAGDLETGLNTVLFTPGDRPVGRLQRPLTVVALGLPPGPAHRKLVEYAAGRYAHLGQKAFAEAAATLDPGANAQVNAHDKQALKFYAQTAHLDPDSKIPAREAAKIIERYVGAKKWVAATVATELFYGLQRGDARTWALARLKVRQATAEEDGLLATNRRLAKALNPLVAKAVAEAVAIVKANPGKANVGGAKSLAGGLVGRYAGLDRVDLAEAVIEAAAGAKGAKELADWALMQRVGLLGRQAAIELARVAAAYDGAGKLTLNDNHKAALALLSQLVKEHPKSEYLGQAVEGVVGVAATYRNYKAFDVATAVLADFVKAHVKLTAAERLKFEGVKVALAKAQAAFADRPDKEKAPDKLSAEYAAAVDALAAFLKAHPTGGYSLSAEQELINVARAYGQAGAWPVARTVLARFKAAVPDFRSPERLKFLEAATYLGELDKAHGLSLFTPPTPTKPRNLAVRDLLVMSAGNLTNALGWPANGEKSDRYAILGDLSGRPAPAVPPPSPTRQPSGEPRRAIRQTENGRFGGRLEDPDAIRQIRQAERQQAVRIARLEGAQGEGQSGGVAGGQRRGRPASVVLPSGPVLSEVEMKRQDAAADAAYGILIGLIRKGVRNPDDRVPDTLWTTVSPMARAEVLWLIGFFEGQRRADRAVVLIERYLKDRPADPERVALAYQAVSDRLAWAGRRGAGERIDQAWIDERHGLFEEARTSIAAFVKEYEDQKNWVNRARTLAVTSYQKEAMLVASVSAARAGGLWARSAMELVALSRAVPDHPEAGQFPRRLWSIGEQLTTLRQREQAIHVLSQIPIRFPTDGLAVQSVQQIASLYAANLSAPLKAVETYQEYMSLAGETEAVRAQIYAIAQNLSAGKRFLEALHVYGVFVDSFPTDGRAGGALLAMGQIHQGNEAWEDAITAYKRILTEYKTGKQVPPSRLAIAECQINLSEWREARRLYQEYLKQYPRDGQAALAKSRIDVLKSLDRYQTLLADKEVTRNKDDAQFQIARIVKEKLANPVKAVAEYRKVIEAHPKSHLADDAQMEIGKALLALNRLDEARAELMKVHENHPGSPLADNALYLIGQSYEQQALRLARVTLKKAREEAFERRQRGAYQQYNVRFRGQQKDLAGRREELRKAGKSQQLELEMAYQASNIAAVNPSDVAQFARLAEQEAETESAIQVANRQDRINEAYRQAVSAYVRAATDYPLGDATDESLLRMAEIHEIKLKDRKAAMATYLKVVKFFPGTPVAENAAWKVASFFEQEGNDDEAVKAYRDFIRNYPASKRVADAQYALAETLERLGRWVEAMDAYETFREKFATHPKAPAARDQIQWIKAYRR